MGSHLTHEPTLTHLTQAPPWLSRWTPCLLRKERQRALVVPVKKQAGRIPRHQQPSQPKPWEEPLSNLRDGIELDGSRLSTHCTTLRLAPSLHVLLYPGWRSLCSTVFTTHAWLASGLLVSIYSLLHCHQHIKDRNGPWTALSSASIQVLV